MPYFLATDRLLFALGVVLVLASPLAAQGPIDARGERAAAGTSVAQQGGGAETRRPGMPSRTLDGLSGAIGGPRPSRAPSGLGGPTARGSWIVSTARSGQPEGYLIDAVRLYAPRFDYFFVPSAGPIRRGTRDEFHAWLRPETPLSIHAHGSFVNFGWAKVYARETAKFLEMATTPAPVQSVMFHWPSDGFDCCFQLDIAQLGRKASFNGLYLHDFLESLPAPMSVTLSGHSHGSRLVTSALHLRGGGAIFDMRTKPHPTPHRLRAIFYAAALDHDWYRPSKRYGRAVAGAESVLNVRNSSDIALIPYPLRRPFASCALATRGFSDRDLRELGPLANRIRQVNVSDEVGHAHTWPFYYSSHAIARLIGPWYHW